MLCFVRVMAYACWITFVFNLFRIEHTASSPHRPTTTLQTSDITSPPQSQRTDDSDHVTSPPASRRRVESPGSQGRPLFSSPNPYDPTSEIDLSSPLTYGTPSSRMVGTPGRGQGTPIRPRTDIGTMRRLREVNLNATDPPVGLRVLIHMTLPSLSLFGA